MDDLLEVEREHLHQVSQPTHREVTPMNLFDDTETITPDMLNRHYGKFGRTFPTREEADAFADEQLRSRVYPLWDVRSGCRVRIGYLVSLEPPQRAVGMRRFTGKPRATSNYD